jgi:hypothetical protein
VGASIPAFSYRAILLLLLKGGLRFDKRPELHGCALRGGRKSMTHRFLGVAKKPYSHSLYLQQRWSHL